MINGKTTGTFAFNNKGGLFLDKAGTSSTGSQYYTDKLVEGINDGEEINISIGNQFKTTANTVEDVDKVHGGGVTDNYELTTVTASGKKVVKKSDVMISGNLARGAKTTFGKALKQNAADILFHELVGHSIPWITKTDTGNAVDNENKVRKELKVPERQADPNHVEQY